MKKVLLAFDGRHFSVDAFEFVKQMNKHQPVMVVGFFLPAADYIELLYSFGGVPAGPLYVNETVKADDKILMENITRFTGLCKQNGIAYKVHSDFTKHVAAHIEEETRFADLLIISGKLFYENLGEDTQDDYMENTLSRAECPVVIVPEEFTHPQNIIMAYDGSEQSVYAIKQFTYLFPEYRDLQVLLAYFNKSNTIVPERDNIEEWLQAHYTRFSITRLGLDTKKDMEPWIKSNGDTMLVSGAYGRSLLSEMFRKSFITEVMHRQRVPIFVAHK